MKTMQKKFKNMMVKHKCIISCGICLKEHREILNRHERALEFLEEVGDNKNEIAAILRGESH